MAGGRDRHIRRRGRNGDRRQHRIAVLRHDLAGGVDREVTGAGVGCLSRGQLHLEEAFAADRQVQLVAGLGGRALSGDAVDRAGFHTGAELDAGRGDGAAVGGLGAGPLDVLVEQILELGPLLLVANRVHVGDIVGDHLHVQLLGGHAGRRCSQSHHGSDSFYWTDPSRWIERLERSAVLFIMLLSWS